MRGGRLIADQAGRGVEWPFNTRRWFAPVVTPDGQEHHLVRWTQDASGAVTGFRRPDGTAGGVLSTPALSVDAAAEGGENGAKLTFKTLQEEVTIAAAATSTSTIEIPAGAVVLAVSTRVTVAIPTATTFTVGDGSTADRFNTGSNVAVAAGTTNRGTKAGPAYFATATPIVITPSDTPAAATGRVRVTIHYYEVTPPTA